MSSAWAVGSWRSSRSLWAAPMTSPSCTTTAPMSTSSCSSGRPASRRGGPKNHSARGKKRSAGATPSPYVRATGMVRDCWAPGLLSFQEGSWPFLRMRRFTVILLSWLLSALAMTASARADLDTGQVVVRYRDRQAVVHYADADAARRALPALRQRAGVVSAGPRYVARP